MNFFSELESAVTHTEVLKSANLPVVMYGTGNGAEKLYRELKTNGIEVSDIFASDGFKSGKIFLGHTVCHFSDILEKYDDFYVVVGFATEIPELIDNILLIKNKIGAKLIMPEVPVFGDGFFTKELLSARKDDIEKVYSVLADEKSKNTFASVLKFKLTGDIDELLKICEPRENVFKEILKLSDNENYLDLGAYDGDTVKEFLQFGDGKITALEPAPKNYQKLKNNCENIKGINLLPFAVSDSVGKGYMSSASGRSPELLNEGGCSEVKTVSVDSLSLSPTYIKYDVEGAELKALSGSINTIKKYKPKMAVSLYHRICDIIDIPIYINSICPEYKLYMRKHLYLPSWETNLYISV